MGSGQNETSEISVESSESIAKRSSLLCYVICVFHGDQPLSQVRVADGRVALEGAAARVDHLAGGEGHEAFARQPPGLARGQGHPPYVLDLQAGAQVRPSKRITQYGLCETSYRGHYHCSAPAHLSASLSLCSKWDDFNIYTLSRKNHE